MKITSRLILTIVVGILLLTVSQCNTTPLVPAIPNFSYLEPIVNPPDTFQIAYNLNTYGDKIAHITFKDNAVWKLQILGDSRALFSVLNPVNDSARYILSVDTIGFRGGLKFSFVANNNNAQNIGLYFVQFTRLPLKYNSFSPRY